MLVIFLFLASLVLLLDEASFNRAFDVIVPAYAVLVALLVSINFVLASRASKSIVDEEIDERKFVLKKASKTWRQKFVGVFEKYERNNFKEFMVFNGAPSIIAGVMAGKAMTQFIESKPDDDNTLKLYSKGVPLVCTSWHKATDAEETSEYVEYTDNGKKMRLKLFWKEEEKTLVVKFTGSNNCEGYHTRKMLDDNTLYHHGTQTKPDGTSMWFEAYYKRI